MKNILLKTVFVTILMVIIPSEVMAHLFDGIPITMSYHNDTSLGSHGAPHKTPVHKIDCPVIVMLDQESESLLLDNTKYPSIVEYDIFDDSDCLIISGIINASSRYIVHLDRLSYGDYHLKLKVGACTYIGEIDL